MLCKEMGITHRISTLGAVRLGAKGASRIVDACASFSSLWRVTGLAAGTLDVSHMISSRIETVRRYQLTAFSHSAQSVLVPRVQVGLSTHVPTFPVPGELV